MKNKLSSMGIYLIFFGSFPISIKIFKMNEIEMNIVYLGIIVVITGISLLIASLFEED